MPARSRRPIARLLPVVVVAVACLFGPGAEPASAQGIFDDYPGCITTELAAQYDAPGDEINFFFDPDIALAIVWNCSAQAAQDHLVPIGRGLLGSLVLIMIVWRGVQYMFGGRLDMGQILSTILLAGFAFALIDNYYSPTPRAMPWGTSQGFVALVAQQGVEWSELIKGNADHTFATSYTQAQAAIERRAVDGFLEVATTAFGGAGLAAVTGDGALNAVVDLAGTAMRASLVQHLHAFAAFALWAIGWLVYAQYLWGYFSLSVVTMVGPLFIPMFVIDQLQEYAWGWFRALLHGVVYMLTGAALYAVLAMVLVAPLNRIAGMPMPATAADSVLAVGELFARMLFEFVPLVVMAVLAAFKVSAMASMVFSGGTPIPSGIGSRLTQAESALGSTAGRAQAGAMVYADRVAASHAPLSSATAGAAGVRAAAAEVHRRVGAVPGAPASRAASAVRGKSCSKS